ncbi:MAG: ABC transporter permease [Acidobacteriaceae bacterium]|nr:ABC transporter permease [Acidobacteriaceae bacterium]
MPDVQNARPSPNGEAIPDGPARQGSLFTDFWRDLLYAIRTLGKKPVFIAFVVLTLALALGANTTVFTVINTLLLNPLPVPRSPELVSVNRTQWGTVAKASQPLPLSYADFQDIRSRATVFRLLAAYSSPHGVTWQAQSSSQGLFLELVTGNYFPTLGLTPARGRFFLPEEDGAPGAHPVAVMNYGTWRLRFGADPSILGRTLRLNNVVVIIIGVAPEHFIGVNAIFGPDLWVPAAMAEPLFPTEMAKVFTDRSKALLQGIGRLRPGVTPAQARVNLAEVAADLAREHPATEEGRTVTLQPIRDVLFANNGARSGSVLFGSVGLFVVVGMILLIACSNVANLLLARAAGRHQEMAVRLALGAHRGRLLRQLLTESLLLGALSGAAGLLFAYTALPLLRHALPSGANFVVPKFDATVFLFALLVSLLTGLLFGTLPALKATDVPLAEILKEEARTMGRSRGKVTLANVLLIGQVAFSFLLLVLAGLFLRSIERAYTIDPGFQTAHLAIFTTSPGQAGYNQPRTKAFYREVRERVLRISGVKSVSWASNLPLWARPAATVEVEGHQKRSRSDTITTVVNTVGHDYFPTAGVAIDRGRPFTEIDQENATPVAIVNEKMAHDNWPDQDPIGKRIQLAGESSFRQVVGVARNANYTNWAELAQPCV